MRHPFDRLLSTWRHIFHSGGWRLLERQFVDNPELAKDFEAAYENITWPLFVRELVLKPQTPLPDLSNYDSPGVWIRWVKNTTCTQDLKILSGTIGHLTGTPVEFVKSPVHQTTF